MVGHFTYISILHIKYLVIKRYFKNNIITFCHLDPFADAAGTEAGEGSEGIIHIRIQQRNGRKTLTTVQGIAPQFDKKKIIKHCKKVST